MSVRAGTRLDGRYRLSERIAVGGMGEVWRGSDEVLGRLVAVKILRAELAEDDAFRKRFRAEARTAGGLPHNGIAAVFDYGETTVGPDGVSPSNDPVQGDGIAYLVMELVPGEALSSMLARDGALGTERTLFLVAQAARALHAAHSRGVVHRDVKPANLMVTPEGRVKVTDFGIARPTDHEPLTMTGQVMGTAHYLAPELARGEDASPLSDVYALGVVAYECLAGHRPFEGDNQVLVATAHLNQQPPPLPGTLAPEVVRVVGAAMEKDPARRIGSAEAFAVALEKLLVHDPSALDGISPGGNHGLQAAAAPRFGPDGAVTGAHPVHGRHSVPETAVPPPRQAPGAPPTVPSGGPSGGQAGGPGNRPQWFSPATAPQALPPIPPQTGSRPGVLLGGPGAPGYPDTYGDDPANRRSMGRGGPSPLVWLVIGVLTLAAVVVTVILATNGPSNGTVDPGTTPTPSTSPSGSLQPTRTPTGSISPTATPSRSKTRTGSASSSPSSSRSPSSSVSPTSSPSSSSPSISPSSPSPTTPSGTSVPPSTPATSPDPTVSLPGSVSVSPALANLLGGAAG